MPPEMFNAFYDELTKIANAGGISKSFSKVAWVNAAETAGLGVLAAPSIHTLASKNATRKEKIHAGAETAGLGILAAHPIHSMYKAVKSGGLKALKHASAKPFPDLSVHGMIKKAAMGKTLTQELGQHVLGSGRAQRIASGMKAMASGGAPAKKTFDMGAYEAAKKAQGLYRGLGKNKAVYVS